MTSSNLTHSTVHNEGCDLHYWTLGTGPALLLFIPGGNGHGRQFYPIMSRLSSQYTTATFDRRQMSASQVTSGPNKKLNPVQQARDIRAVIQALGFKKAILFGSSSGGIFAFQFAHDFPEMVDRLISHEAGIVNLLPDASELYEWSLHLLDLYKEEGLEAVAAEFEDSLTGYKDEGIPDTATPEPENVKNFWDNEFPGLLGYMPNFWRLKENKVSIGVMRGVRCKEAFFARAVVEQAKILECPYKVVPGHHQGFEVEVEEFVPYLLGMLETLERNKKNEI